MSDQATEPVVCPECGEEFKAAMHLANHRKHKHGIEPEGKRPRLASSGGGRSPVGLEGRIRDACLGTAAVAAISDPRIYIAVEGTVDQFAKSWAEVARQSPTAKRYIEAILTGGVWIPAVMSTVVMVVAILMATDRLPTTMSGLGYYALSQMKDESVEKLRAMYVAPVSANGGEPVGPEAAGDQ